MKFFLVSHKGVLLSKDAFSGDDLSSRSIVENTYPGMDISEVDEKEFDSVVLIPKETKEQAEWKAAKDSGFMGSVSFLGKKLGLE